MENVKTVLVDVNGNGIVVVVTVLKM